MYPYFKIKGNSIINRHGKTKESKVERKTKLKINFLSVEQGGKSILVNACKNIAAKVKTELLRSSDIEQQLVDNHVLGEF
jgi:undecaprenyl pyrophosphate synthase